MRTTNLRRDTERLDVSVEAFIDEIQNQMKLSSRLMTLSSVLRSGLHDIATIVMSSALDEEKVIDIRKRLVEIGHILEEHETEKGNYFG